MKVYNHYALSNVDFLYSYKSIYNYLRTTQELRTVLTYLIIHSIIERFSVQCIVYDSELLLFI